MINTPATPPGTPALPHQGDDYRRRLDRLERAPTWLDHIRLVRPSTVAITAAIPSSIGAVLSLWVTGGLAVAHPLLFHLVAWYYWYVGPSLLTIGIVFGLRSESRLVRFLTVHTPIGLLMAIGATRILGIGGVGAEWGKWAYGLVTLTIGLPYLVNRLVGWFRARVD